jgi:hypothetical protein
VIRIIDAKLRSQAPTSMMMPNSAPHAMIVETKQLVQGDAL